MPRQRLPDADSLDIRRYQLACSRPRLVTTAPLSDSQDSRSDRIVSRTTSTTSLTVLGELSITRWIGRGPGFTHGRPHQQRRDRDDAAVEGRLLELPHVFATVSKTGPTDYQGRQREACGAQGLPELGFPPAVADDSAGSSPAFQDLAQERPNVADVLAGSYKLAVSLLIPRVQSSPTLSANPALAQIWSRRKDRERFQAPGQGVVGRRRAHGRILSQVDPEHVGEHRHSRATGLDCLPPSGV